MRFFRVWRNCVRGINGPCFIYHKFFYGNFFKKNRKAHDRIKTQIVLFGRVVLE
jgi:hypothetical protein